MYVYVYVRNTRTPNEELLLEHALQGFLLLMSARAEQLTAGLAHHHSMRRSPRQAVAITARFRESTTVQDILASQPLPHGRVWCNPVPLVVFTPRSWRDQSDSSIICKVATHTLRNITVLCQLMLRECTGPFREGLACETTSRATEAAQLLLAAY